MSNRIAIPAAALAGLVVMMPPIFVATAVPASGCVKAFATETISNRDDQTGLPAGPFDLLRPMLSPCDLVNRDCQDSDRTKPASSDG